MCFGESKLPLFVLLETNEKRYAVLLGVLLRLLAKKQHLVVRLPTLTCAVGKTFTY